MAITLKGTPTADEAENDQETGDELEEGEEHASPVEQDLLHKVMTAVYQALSQPKYIRQAEAWMVHSKNISADIGHMAFMLLASIYTSAKKAGQLIPPSVFFAQGGAAYLTIERLLLLAEKFQIHGLDPDHIREQALGVLVENAKKMFGPKGPQADQQPDQGGPPGQGGPPQPDQGGPPMLAANPMSHAVGQGLAQQGLMGAQ